VIPHHDGARCAITAITPALVGHSQLQFSLTVIIAIPDIERKRRLNARIPRCTSQRLILFLRKSLLTTKEQHNKAHAQT
jgi:hypothetical protein